MQAIEFETTPMHHTIRVPDNVPDGVEMRVLLLWEPAAAPNPDLKKLFSSAIEGLSDEDLARSQDLGREDASWDI